MGKTREWSATIVLAGLLAITILGLVLTRGSGGPSTRRSAEGAAGQPGAVDQTPLRTAEKLAALAVTPEQQEFAQQALQLADQVVDVGYAAAVRHAMEHPAPPTPEAQALETQLKQAQARVQADEDDVARLKRLAGAAGPAKKGEIEGQLQLAQAQLALDQDEMADAQRDLTRAQGGQASAVEQMLEEHEKSVPHTTAATPGAAPVTAQPAHLRSLVARLEAWETLQGERKQLDRAQRDAKARAADLVRRHDTLEQQIKTKASAPAAVPAPGAARGVKEASPTAASVASLRQLRFTQQDLADLDKQIEDENGLADVYGKWSAQVAASEQSLLHRVIRSVFWIVLFLLLAVLADQVIGGLFSRLGLDRKDLHTAQSVLRFGTRSLAAVLVLIVVFGPPSQLAAILALAGAGLTVALKDFIVGFFGWFVLMGRNGMRPGDWVEINGVQGKVLEVGLLHTVILETGNWTDAGHPTGRKVTFVNSFAVEGHYFNFTTAGQWLWDEVQIGLPARTNPQPMLEAIRKVAAEETAANTELAEHELQRVMANSGMGSSFTGAPTVMARPTDQGMFIVIRYITRADEREALRFRLYRAALDLLVKEHALAPAGEQPRESSA
jgi:small-conductance mechanosensitive channel